MRTFASALMAATAFANSRPIYGTYPGFLVGDGKANIQIEVFMDYLCSACFAENPVLEQLLSTEWLDGTVRDQVTMAFSPFPLPYHTHAYQVAQLVPYFMDLCIESGGAQCYSTQYKDFSFA